MNHRQLDTPPSVEIQPTHDDVSNSRRIEWDGWNDRALRETMEKMAISQTNGTKEGGEIPAVWKWELPGSGVKLKRG